jgi:hypothetical protein
MLDENRVQKMRKKRGEPADSRCKLLFKACGFPAAKQRRSGGNGSEIGSGPIVRKLLKFC